MVWPSRWHKSVGQSIRFRTSTSGRFMSELSVKALETRKDSPILFNRRHTSISCQAWSFELQCSHKWILSRNVCKILLFRLLMLSASQCSQEHFAGTSFYASTRGFSKGNDQWCLVGNRRQPTYPSKKGKPTESSQDAGLNVMETTRRVHCESSDRLVSEIEGRSLHLSKALVNARIFCNWTMVLLMCFICSID